MKIALMDFQEEAVRRLSAEIRSARREVADMNKAQAIILSSPTGSGKTVTITALLERILQGDEDFSADPEAVFLWLSDSPELNEQSRDKILTQSSVFRDHELIVVEPPFSREQFEPGRVYFLNTQKLGRDNLLTKTGDGRDFTVWQTIENTAQAKPRHFYLVIDEAHRGMNLTARQEQQAQTIVQKFIFGDPGVGLSPIMLVIGISATPERFARVIRGQGAARTERPYTVPPSAVRESGLLKDKIILYCPDRDQPSDWTLLSEAAKRWRRCQGSWRAYCKEQDILAVDPVLVIQVEDAATGRLTRTNLDQAVEILEREAGHFGADSLAHCFEIEGDIPAGNHQIRKIEPSKIQQDSVARVVFFKMALSTGWDCPRAEVMMSFRRARVHTSIAQLVGRMVRAPLARRVEGSELLNTVSLYLPHYDRAGLRSIVDKLNDPENAPPTDVVDGSQLVTLSKSGKHKAMFDALADIPSYSVERVPKSSNVRRFVKLARQLAIDGIDVKAWPQAKALLIDTLTGELDRLRQDSRFARHYRQNEVIAVREVQVEAGEWKETGDEKVRKVKATPENIDDLFDVCGRMLGEGLHKEYWKAKRDREDPQRAKLELHGVLQDQAAWKRLENVAKERLAELSEQHKAAIRGLTTSKKEEYNRIRRRSKDPQPISLLFPDSFDVKREGHAWPHHLYVDETGSFAWDADTWEAAVLESEIDSGRIAGWLRNFPRKDWSLCVPYRRGGEEHALYPDLIVLRRDKSGLKVDLLDPHNPDLDDAFHKAHGLSHYAERHGDFFGRSELVALDKN
ncbi:MAG: DEAD/DEAH box helicase family protein, partial [Phycisphaerae bacterium]|nr:DEAD/DEAH box helicase family protein [Phycisphaerae bacterium]